MTNVEFFEREGVAGGNVGTWERTNAPYVLPDDFKAFLQMTDGLLLRWSMFWQREILPLGCIQVNPLSQVVRLPLGNGEHEREVEEEETHAPAYATLRGKVVVFDLDSTCADGRVALYYNNGPRDPEVWFQDLSCTWFFLAKNFTDYFRLLIMHLGLPRWQYAFTSVGLDPAAKQWFRFLSPERLAIDMQYAKGGAADAYAATGSAARSGKRPPTASMLDRAASSSLRDLTQSARPGSAAGALRSMTPFGDMPSASSASRRAAVRPQSAVAPPSPQLDLRKVHQMSKRLESSRPLSAGPLGLAGPRSSTPGPAAGAPGKTGKARGTSARKKRVQSATKSTLASQRRQAATKATAASSARTRPTSAYR